MPPVPEKKRISTTTYIFIVGLVFFLLSIGSCSLFTKLNTTIKACDGKVAETYSKKEFASKKQTYDQEYDVVHYTVNGKSYTKTTPAPKTGSSQYMPVYYYEKYPEYAWCKSKHNSAFFFSMLSAIFFGGISIVSLRIMLKKPPVEAAQGSGKKKVDKKS